MTVATRTPGPGSSASPPTCSGSTVAYTHGGIRDELIFDPDTAGLLGSISVLVDPDAVGIDLDSEAPGTTVAYAGPAGEVVYSAVYLDSGVVDSAGQRP